MPLFDDTYNYMKYEFETRSNCIISDTSDAAIKLKVVASQIQKLFDKLDFYEKQVYPNSAEGEYLIKHGQAKGIYKKAATKAVGHIIFECKTPALTDIVIPAGTLCTSTKNPELMYETTAAAILKTGTTFIAASASAVTAGSFANVAANHIDVLVSPIASISRIYNAQKICGGSDKEPDELYRQRVIESYQKITNGANLAYYEQWAKSQEDVWYAKAIFEGGSVNRLQLYVENSSRTISDQTIALLQAKSEDIRQLGVMVTVLRPTPKPINVNMKILIDNLSNELDFVMSTERAFVAQMDALSIGERFSPNALAGKILQNAGILDVYFTTPNAPVEVAAGEIATIGNCIINVERG